MARACWIELVTQSSESRLLAARNRTAAVHNNQIFQLYGREAVISVTMNLVPGCRLSGHWILDKRNVGD